ncbi:CGNR zinc finger domain-containing protein [Promicromonospora sp. NPDC090134]|uniref:CGNR zinc finger domain-containing protein n=1 Tax=Promicromonospora sp. NPDC090134 TaxID=3364408 RepID=UPI003825E8AB
MNHAQRTARAASAAPIIALMNSRPHAVYGDRLDDAAYVSTLLASFDVDATEAPDAVAELRSLRAALEPAITADDEASVADGWRAVSRFSSDVLFRFQYAADGAPILEHASGGELRARMLTALTQLLESGDWSRIKECANEECKSLFLDDTKNRSQRWHSYETCGNKINAAAHRARRTAANAGSSPEHA